MSRSTLLPYCANCGNAHREGPRTCKSSGRVCAEHVDAFKCETCSEEIMYGECGCVGNVGVLRTRLADAERERDEARAAVAELHGMVARGDHGSVKANLACAISNLSTLRLDFAEAARDEAALEKRAEFAEMAARTWKALARRLRSFGPWPWQSRENLVAEVPLLREQRLTAWQAVGTYADRATAAERVSAISRGDARAILDALPACSCGENGVRCTRPKTVAFDASIGATWKRDAHWWRGGGGFCDACKARLEADGEKLDGYVDVPHAGIARDLAALLEAK